MHTQYTTCRDLIRAEYGDSRNPMTPNVLTIGGVPGKWAAEVAHGEGILPGTVIVGVSVVLATEDGTERCYDLSTSFHGSDVNALTDEALEYMRGLDGEIDDLLARCLELEVGEEVA